MKTDHWLRSIVSAIYNGTRTARKQHTRRHPGVTHIEPLESRQLLSVDSFVRIADQANGGPDVLVSFQLGKSVAGIGDINGDGVEDVAIGANHVIDNQNRSGAVHILLMNANGTGKSLVSISSGQNGGPLLQMDDTFGSSIAGIGDLDGDNVPDLAVGAPLDDTGGPGRGAVYILFMNANGTAKSFTKIASGTNGGPTLSDGIDFGRSVTAISDTNNDGIRDLVVGSSFDNTSGALFVLRMNTDGTVKSHVKIASGLNGGPNMVGSDRFGHAVADAGDIDGDAVSDLVVGAPGDPNGGLNLGAAYLVFMNADGTAKSTRKFTAGAPGGPIIGPFAGFGRSVSAMGDLDGDGVPEVVIGSQFDNDDGSLRGAINVIFLNSDGSPKVTGRIASNVGGGPPLANSDQFGAAMSLIGDLNNDGVKDLIVGAPGDSKSQSESGAAYILFLNDEVPIPNVPPTVALNGGPVNFAKGSAPVSIVPAVTLTDPDTTPEYQIPSGEVIFSINTLVANKKKTVFFDTLNVSGLDSVGLLLQPLEVNGRIQYRLLLDSNVTVSQIENALRGITFTTTKKGLKTSTRNVQFQVIDNASGVSNTVTQTINVQKKPPKGPRSAR